MEYRNGVAGLSLPPSSSFGMQQFPNAKALHFLSGRYQDIPWRKDKMLNSFPGDTSETSALCLLTVSDLFLVHRLPNLPRYIDLGMAQNTLPASSEPKREPADHHSLAPRSYRKVPDKDIGPESA
ncbi:predicted protein [Histoplasma capsulatum G186AR]|uniref:Uncharacterized protein n=1 Tax=Ajellomyces capsulatus (strain G186AR / H82 / ATCC MYA-2454 / RMSCC 2432) TaxID=447093 RepID=C0NX14_AJECG|nr:uncharacterized protein HCBG_08006 [Histoplasma capsulatum G186AR]EEH03880.1 predicted protein [Histoplasma capsulatum G186AR]